MKRSATTVTTLRPIPADPGAVAQPPATQAVAPAPAHRPGYCALHPNQALVTHRAANVRRWGEDPKTICVMCLADDRVGERCRQCGGPLFHPETRPWQVSNRRAFCSPACRLHHYRAAKRGATS